MCAGDLCGRLVVAVVHRRRSNRSHDSKYSYASTTYSEEVGWTDSATEAIWPSGHAVLSEEVDPGSCLFYTLDAATQQIRVNFGVSGII